MRNRRKKFFEVHREEIMIHKEAKKPFGELGVKRILNVKQLNAEYARLMEEKIQTSTEYWKARDEVREYIIIKENIASMRRNERKMELIGNGSRNRSVKNTGPGICENAGALCRFFRFPDNKDFGIYDS